MLTPGTFAKALKAFVLKANKTVQGDPDKAIDAFCQNQEKAVDARIKSITITIPTGMITVMTPQGPGSNVAPIVLIGVIT